MSDDWVSPVGSPVCVTSVWESVATETLAVASAVTVLLWFTSPSSVAGSNAAGEAVPSPVVVASPVEVVAVWMRVGVPLLQSHVHSQSHAQSHAWV